MYTEDDLMNLKQELETARAATVLAYSNMILHRGGENANDHVVGELLQHRYLAADSAEINLVRRISEAEESLDAPLEGIRLK